MATLPDIPQVNFATGRHLVSVAMVANQAPMLIGDPGVGKSAMMELASKDYERITGRPLPLYSLLGSTLDSTDIGGLPLRSTDGTHIMRIPLEEIYRCAEAPGMLFLDELSTAPGPVQAAMLRLILERKAGSVTLHPETRVVAACNPPEQAPSGFELSAPLVGRMAIVNFRPDDSEVIEYFRGLGSDEENATPFQRALRNEAEMFAAVASANPELLQIDIPPSCVNGGLPWASPRSCERMIRARASAIAADINPASAAVFALTAGSVGNKVAISYSGTVRMITELPTVETIVENPITALCPDDKAKQVAALGLMPQIAKSNLWAAFVYANRLRPEFSLAAHKALIKYTGHLPSLKAQWAQEGLVARNALAVRAGGPAAASIAKAA